ncbi:cytochrome c oxidase subunit I [Rubrivirga sp. SAORIC476]|uniref:cytochrome c oxidase subunit I n=1 Tax=Rubrivirga sp. SAORIC476 TaxID=1961794 RepID=UPI000BA93FEA|nr:cytochrome c oxidase subunit I [Rubrivirga sp. SAORIC476]MBC14486.1 cytochrome c oxidase subunit I [Rhodothermaceae bacterium]
MATLSPPSPTTTALPTEARSYPVGHEPVHNYLREPRPADDVRGLARAWAWIKSWALSVDHKRIGIMYLVAVSVFFSIAGILALLIRTELFTVGETIMGQDTYNRVFTMHGLIMVFLFIIPSIPATMGNFLLPIMVGAKDVAFPRLNLLSLYVYAAGALIALYSITTGGVDTGWTFYTPYSKDTGTAVIAMALGAFVMGFSSILTGLNFIVTIHKMRAPGMTWNRMPLFLWSIYATSIVQVLATPVIGITMVLLVMERLLGVGIFDPALGGDPVLFQHFFWFYSHPAVYIMILPAFGVISELMGTFSRQRVYGYRAVALSSVAIALLGFLVWGHHMFTSGQSPVSSVVFSLITFLIGIPSGIKIFNWVWTMYKGSVWLKTPMLYALSFLFLFTIGGVTGIMVGALAVDIHLHDTYFVVAHFHYVMMGGTVIAFLGGIHYWWPKMTGKLYNETLGKVSALLVFVGFNLTFFIQFVMGSQGMPRRYHDYPDMPWLEPLHQVSTIGSYVLGLGLLVVLVNGLLSLRKKTPKAPGNPWGGATLEWTHTTSPPDHHNFHHTPLVTHGPYDYEVLFKTSGDSQRGAPVPVVEVGGPQETTSVDDGTSQPDSATDM